MEPFWSHQLETVEFASSNAVVLDTSDPGTGKTRGHLETFRRRFHAGLTGPALVLAPKTALEIAWGEDMDKYFPDLEYSVAFASNRERAFDKQADVYITNSDAVKWLAKQSKAWFRKRGFLNSTILSDEHSCFKNPDSDRSKAAQHVFKMFQFRTGMGATPDPNSVTELWHQMFLLDQGERLGSSFYKFRSSVCRPEQNGPRPEHRIWVDKDGAEAAVASLLSDVTIRHDFDEVMDIPKNFQQFVRYTPPQKLLKKYWDMELHSLLELEEKEVVGINAAVQAAKLCQIASGAVYHSDGSYTVIDDSRYELITETSKKQRHNVIFFNWAHQKEQLAKYMKKAERTYEILDSTVSDKRRKGIRAAFQRGDLQNILLHPQTGAHALTLTRGTATIWSSPVHQADFIRQGKFRIYRGGQTKRTYTKKVCANGTVDEHVYANADRKGNRMNTFLDLLRKRRGVT